MFNIYVDSVDSFSACLCEPIATSSFKEGCTKFENRCQLSVPKFAGQFLTIALLAIKPR